MKLFYLFNWKIHKEFKLTLNRIYKSSKSRYFRRNAYKSSKSTLTRFPFPFSLFPSSLWQMKWNYYCSVLSFLHRFPFPFSLAKIVEAFSIFKFPDPLPQLQFCNPRCIFRYECIANFMIVRLEKRKQIWRELEGLREIQKSDLKGMGYLNLISSFSMNNCSKLVIISLPLHPPLPLCVVIQMLIVYMQIFLHAMRN